jgi:predicted nucleic acid-binding protein
LAEVLLRSALSLFFVREIAATDAVLHVPELCDLEFLSVLKGGLARGVLSKTRAADLLLDYRSLPINRHRRHEELLDRILELRDNFSVYDACYVALAERMDAALVTADQRLAAAVRAHLPLAVISGNL